MGKNISAVAATSLLPHPVASRDVSSDHFPSFALLLVLYNLGHSHPIFLLRCTPAFLYPRPDLSWKFGAILY